MAAMELAPSTSGDPALNPVVVTLEEEDVEGAVLEEPLETKTIQQLCW
jgi:hypothetical protein